MGYRIPLRWLALAVIALLLLAFLHDRMLAESMTEQDVRSASAHWSAYYGVPAQCAVDVARRETGGTFNPTAENGRYWGWFEFGLGEDSIWSLSSDWILLRLEPRDVDLDEQVRVFFALWAEYPGTARSAWAPAPASCP